MTPTLIPRGRVYRDVEWPHGLRCAECDRLFADGETYESVFESMLEEGTPIMLVVCVPCAERRAT